MKAIARSVLMLALVSGGALCFGAVLPSGATTVGTAPDIGTPTDDDRATANAPTVLYSLEPTSVYVSGCFPAPPFACAGPLTLWPEFGGSFGLTALGRDERGFSVFGISELALEATGGDESREVLGFGIYRRRDGADPVQEMILFTVVNGEPSVFHSNVVPVPADSPDAIDIAVTMNDLQNYDTLMQIRANPGK